LKFWPGQSPSASASTQNANDVGSGSRACWWEANVAETVAFGLFARGDADDFAKVDEALGKAPELRMLAAVPGCGAGWNAAAAPCRRSGGVHRIWNGPMPITTSFVSNRLPAPR